MKRNFKYLVDKHNIAGAREEFERLCEDVLKKEYPLCNVHGVKVSQGDGGIDVFIGDINSSMDVYQCKFFIDGIGSSQKTQIKDSFEKVMSEYGNSVNNWVLCVPCELNRQNYEWWFGYKAEKENEYSVPLGLLTENDLLNLLKKHNLYDEYFGLTRMDTEFFNSLSNKNNRLEEIENDFAEIINLTSHIPYKIHIEQLDLINFVVNKYRGKKEFVNSSIIDSLEKMGLLIGFTSGEMRDDEDIKSYIGLAKSIREEYTKIIQNV